jgi:hypothetical protein
MDQFASRSIPPNERQAIDRSLLRAIIMSGIAFQTANNAFFADFVHKLNPSYTMPDRRRLSRDILTQEVLHVEKKNVTLLNEAAHLTLNLDGWSDQCGRSLYEYNVITDSRQAIVLSLIDISINSHSATFLHDRLEAVLLRASTTTNITAKIRAIVTDNPNVMIKLRELFITKPGNQHIIELRCFAHAINLIAGKKLFTYLICNYRFFFHRRHSQACLCQDYHIKSGNYYKFFQPISCFQSQLEGRSTANEDNQRDTRYNCSHSMV